MPTAKNWGSATGCNTAADDELTRVSGESLSYKLLSFASFCHRLRVEVRETRQLVAAKHAAGGDSPWQRSASPPPPPSRQKPGNLLALIPTEILAEHISSLAIQPSECKPMQKLRPGGLFWLTSPYLARNSTAQYGFNGSAVRGPFARSACFLFHFLVFQILRTFRGIELVDLELIEPGKRRWQCFQCTGIGMEQYSSTFQTVEHKVEAEIGERLL